MKKTKAKPVKGSARAKKFDAGGLAALAGLGALAYMMRKKKGESEGSAPKDKSGYSSGPVDVGRMIEGSRDEESRTPSATKFGGASNLGPAITESGTRPGSDTTEPKLERKTASAPRRAAATPAKKAATEGFGKIRDISQSPRISDMKKVRDLALKHSIGAEERKSIVQKQEQARLAEFAKRGAVPEKEMQLSRSRLDAVNKTADRAGEEFMNRDMPLRRDAEARGKGDEYDRMKRGGAVKASKMGTVKQAKPSMGSASKRADGIAQRGKTKGRVL
jgi:hypothetical protein